MRGKGGVFSGWLGKWEKRHFYLKGRYLKIGEEEEENMIHSFYIGGGPSLEVSCASSKFREAGEACLGKDERGSA